jgi:hypothetical protein
MNVEKQTITPRDKLNEMPDTDTRIRVGYNKIITKSVVDILTNEIKFSPEQINQLKGGHELLLKSKEEADAKNKNIGGEGFYLQILMRKPKSNGEYLIVAMTKEKPFKSNREFNQKFDEIIKIMDKIIEKQNVSLVEQALARDLFSSLASCYEEETASWP